MEPTFKDFIAFLLKNAKLDDVHMEFLLSAESLKRFQVAFTHKSVSIEATDNYELSELVGDSVINTIIISHIRSRFPRIVNVDWISRIKNTAISKDQLSVLAFNNGFLKWIHMSDAGQEHDSDVSHEKRELVNLFLYNSRIDPNDIASATLYRVSDGYIDFKRDIAETFRIGYDKLFLNAKFKSLLEDTMEAFVGTLQSMIDKYEGAKYPDFAIYGNLPGPGYAVCSYIISKFLSEVNIPIDYESVFDPKSRLKQHIFDPKSLSFKEYFKTIELKTIPPTFRTIISIPDISKNERVLVADITRSASTGNMGSEMEASRRALDVIAGKKYLPNTEIYLNKTLQRIITPSDPYRSKQSLN